MENMNWKDLRCLGYKTDAEAINFASNEPTRTRIISGRYFGRKFYFAVYGSHELHLGPTEKVIYDNIIIN